MPGLSPARAVVVIGDLNTDARSASAFAPVETLMAAAGLRDARGWETLGSPWARRLDHLLYRDGDGTRLGTPVVREDRTFGATDGAPLSDHPAMGATFDVTHDP